MLTASLLEQTFYQRKDDWKTSHEFLLLCIELKFVSDSNALQHGC